MMLLQVQSSIAGPFDFQVGLDDGTLNMINGLPDKIKTATLDLLRDAMPIVDNSVNEYIDRVSSSISQNISAAVTQVSCDANGGVKNVSDYFSNSFLATIFPFHGILPTKVSANVSDLGDYIDQTRARLSPTTTAEKMAGAYADLLIYASFVQCAANAVNSPATVAIAVEGRANTISDATMEWAILAGNNYCSTPDDCVQKRVADLDKFLQSADKRDVDAADANTMVHNLPSAPPVPSLWQYWGLQAFDISPYEKLLLSMRAIERRVAAERLERERQAQVAWCNGIKGFDDIGKLMSTEIAEVNSPTSNVDFANAIPRTDTLDSWLDNTQGPLKKALSLDSRYGDVGARLQNYIDAARKVTAQIRERAKEALTTHPFFVSGNSGLPGVDAQPPSPDLSGPPACKG